LKKVSSFGHDWDDDDDDDDDDVDDDDDEDDDDDGGGTGKLYAPSCAIMQPPPRTLFITFNHIHLDISSQTA
jgi:hypothetical protein